MHGKPIRQNHHNAFQGIWQSLFQTKENSEKILTVHCARQAENMSLRPFSKEQLQAELGRVKKLPPAGAAAAVNTQVLGLERGARHAIHQLVL